MQHMQQRELLDAHQPARPGISTIKVEPPEPRSAGDIAFKISAIAVFIVLVGTQLIMVVRLVHGLFFSGE